jgi:hypothetical protein
VECYLNSPVTLYLSILLTRAMFFVLDSHDKKYRLKYTGLKISRSEMNLLRYYETPACVPGPQVDLPALG